MHALSLSPLITPVIRNSFMSHQTNKTRRFGGYLVDLQAGMHQYVNVEGVGECREPFMRLVADLENGKIDAVIVYKAKYLFIETSPMWMEKFIATVKRRRALIADAETGREYDLNDPSDEATFRSLGEPR
jgi:hypothetical protein